ncbi:MAG TPA: hypothetical protein VMS21_01240 [Methylomirabilota bacterium]|nr:hypothetical protein [Methylomirabilota bacterium]
MRRLRIIDVLLIPGLILGTSGALESAPVDPNRSIQSRSRQFLVAAPPHPTSIAPPAYRPPGNNRLQLDPELLAVSCERIKQALLETLDLRDEWREQIYITLQPVIRDNPSIGGGVTRHPDGWRYQMVVPTEVEKDRLIRAMVQVLLMEMSNRYSTGRPAEIPEWLIEGMSAHLQVDDRGSLVLQGTSFSSLMASPLPIPARSGRYSQPLDEVRKRLGEHPPLTFNELSWPTRLQLAGEDDLRYHDSVHLFVRELLRLPDGPQCLKNMLALLPQTLNWQTAFLEAFKPHFQRLIDVEKWWALAQISFTGRQADQRWSADESWRQLSASLTATVRVRSSPDELPREFTVRLPRIIGEWNFAQQRPVLSAMHSRLRILEGRVTSDFTGLVTQYANLIDGYLKRRVRMHNPIRGKGRVPPNLNVLINATLQDLRALDEQLRLREPGSPAGETGGGGSSRSP